MAEAVRSGSLSSVLLPNLDFIGPGDVIYLNVAGQPMIVLNSQKVAADLLDRRAGIYSDRARNIVAGEIMTGGLVIFFSRYNDTYVLLSLIRSTLELHSNFYH